MHALARLVLAALVLISGVGAGQVILPVAPADPGAPDVHLLGPASALPAKARVNVFLEVVNLGPGGMHDVNVLVQPDGTSGLVIVGQIDRDLEDLAANDSAPMAVRVATPDTAGGATLALTFSFRDDAGIARTVTRVVSIQIAPPVSDPLVVNFEGGTLSAGQQGNVTLALANPSKERITNLDLVMETEEPRVTLTRTTSDLTPGTESSEILKGASLGPGESMTLVAPIMTSLEAEDLQRFTITAQYTYQGFARDQSFDFGARITGTVRLRVLEAREVPTAGGLFVEGSLVNTGSGTAWNPRVTVSEGSGLRAASPKLIEDLKPNDAVDFRLLVERVRPATGGAPLLVVDWNDDHGEVHTLDVEGSATPPPPAPPSRFANVWRFLTSPVALIILMLLVLAGVGASLVHAYHLHQQHVAEGTAHAWRWERKGPRKPRGKGGARPGG